MKCISKFGVMGLLFLTGCASSSHKARLEHREKLAQSSGLYCEWVNGDKHSDIDVEINLQMAKRCDSNKPFSLTPYKNSSDANGVLYCCSMANGEVRASANAGKRKSSGPAATAAGAPVSAPSSADGKGAAPVTADDEIVEDK